jgi:chemosensory pili system protein ChpA (sensor histidine kinase/response regulator)
MRNVYGIETDPAIIQIEKWKAEIEAERLEAERLEAERRETERAETERLEVARLVEADSNADAELEAGDEIESEEWAEESEPELTEEQQRANRARLESVFKSYACTGLSFPAVRLTPVPRADVENPEPERIPAIVADVLSGRSSSIVRW